MRRLLVPVLLSAAAIAVTFRRLPTNPPVVPGQSLEAALRPPARVVRMLQRSCYDCHSNETRWPWYSRVPVLGGKLERDVTQARAAFNFSEWASGPYSRPRAGASMLLGMCAAIRVGQMPRKDYLMLHPWARPAPAEIDEFCTWSRSEAKRLVEDARQSLQPPAPQSRLIRLRRIAR